MIRRWATGLTALSVLAAAPARAEPAVVKAAPAPASASVQVPHERYKLANGLEVILAPDRSVPLVAVDVWYHVGSGNEVKGRSGFAHLFEHMMFQGSKHTGEDAHFDTLRRIGASQVNGTTSSDRTNYFEQVPANQLQTALWLESDRMGWLLDLVNQKSLDNQREVVRNERRQRYDNVPYGKERFALHEALYGENHPYRYLTIGRHEDLEQAALADVQAFFRQWYVPSNATLCLAGDFDVAEARTLVQKWFGSLAKVEPPEHRAVAPTPVQGPIRTVIEDPFARLRRVHFAWHSPKTYAVGDAELDLLAHALANPGTGRLYKLLVHEKQWAQSVTAYQAGAQFSSIFHVIVDVKPDADLAEVERLTALEVERVINEPIGPRELARAVADIESTFVWGLEGLMARAEVLQGYNHFLGNPDRIGWDLKRYRQATVAGIRTAAAASLGPRGRVAIVTVPQAAPAAKPAVPAPAAALPAGGRP
jgi:predicted Zn-dependent peptidase